VRPAPPGAGFDFPVDGALLRRVVGVISSVGSHPLGFRAAGTPEEHEVTELVAAEMRILGLSSVGFEEVPVDALELIERCRSAVPRVTVVLDAEVGRRTARLASALSANATPQ